MANPNMALVKLRNCSAPELYDAVTDFCFGHADDATRRLVEEHLIGCAVCRRETARLTSAVEVLRFDQELMPPATGNEVASAFGWSSRLHQPFAGHWWLAVISCAVYAGLYVAVMWVEIGLQYDRYAAKVSLGSPVIFGLIAATTYATLKLCWRRAVRGDEYSLTLSFLILLSAALAAYGLSWLILPQSSINGVSTPQEIYVQNAGLFFSLALICLLVPFHFVVTLQRELAEGKHSAIFKLLRRDKDAVPARHTIYLRIWPVLITLALQVYLIWWMQFNFTNKLPPGNYRAFYVTVSQTTWFVYFVLGTSWMIWYYRMINELKRECLIAEAFPPK